MQVRWGGEHTGQVASTVAGSWEGTTPAPRKAHHAEEPGRLMVTGLGTFHLLAGMGAKVMCVGATLVP